MGSTASRSTKRVVIIDDDVDLGEVLAMLLAAEGYRAETASTGKGGISLAIQTHADAVLLDFMLPDMSGAEVGQQLRKDPSTRDLKVLMCTSAPEELVRPYFDGYEAFLRKPVHPQLLVKALDEALGVR